MALKKIKTDSITDDAITAVKLHDDIYLSTGSFKVPSGTTAQRGTTATGAFRFNTTDTSFEGYDGSAWGAIGGAEMPIPKKHLLLQQIKQHLHWLMPIRLVL